MDLVGIVSRFFDVLFNHPWSLAGVLAVIFLVVLFWSLIPKPRRWHCSRCGEQFWDEASAKGHQAIHGEHRAVMEMD